MVRVARFDLLLASLLGLAALGSFVKAFPKDDLYPYATSSVLETDSEGQLVSAQVNLQTPIVFYDKTYDTVYVNGNGVLSFIRAMQRFFNIPFPLDDPAIAPLYTHVDTRRAGAVYWTETDAPGVLSRAETTVRRAFKDAEDFAPTSVFLATWVDVGYFSAKSDKLNTYQVVISSNGTLSFVELLYPEGGIQWIQGDSHPSGLPDAKAQAGFMSEGRMYTLKGSGTDQIQNIDKWSNVNEPGRWVFLVGPIDEGQNVKVPDNIEDASVDNEIPTCMTEATSCHSKASCVDYEVGFCCACKEGFFGNGKSCQPNDVPLRIIGKVTGKVNDDEFLTRDLQCYVQTKDGRTYTALSRVPETLGASFQLLSILGGVIGWLFAKPIGQTKNGYQLTGGFFNHTADLVFPATGDKVTVRSTYLGLDVFGQLKMEADIRGSLPDLADDAKVDYGDHDELYTRAQPGTILSQSSRIYKIAGVEYPFSQEQAITYQECPYGAKDPEEDTTRLKFSRGITNYEATEGIIRFAMNTKIAPLEEEDPCIQGRATCGDHSSCVVEGDDFKCVCNPGYQYLYEEAGNAICVDINECTAGYHVCSPDAMCVNTEGSHTCHCRVGYTGDGHYCKKSATCENTRCDNYEQCEMVSGLPVCTCIAGYENTEQGCYPVEKDSCDVANNCSPQGICSYDGNKQLHVCVCLPGFYGDGYNCYSESEGATTVPSTNEPPRPQCIIGLCWCETGWEYRNNACVKQDDDAHEDGDDHAVDRDLSARPLPECFEAECICPWGYDYNRRDEICVPLPGYIHETMGPTGSQLSCNVVNRCHPYAQCVLVTSLGDYECRCNPGYEGDGMECSKTEVSCVEVDICDPNASCQHEEQLSKCVCNPGFKGDGTTCSAIDECNDHADCEENEHCSYNPASSRYECACNPGFGMVDGQCVVADCSTNPSQCHVNGQCVSTGEGGYRCVCISGYHGDGVQQCVADHIGCNVFNKCGKNAMCGYNQTSANYACVCQPGYYGDGFTCLPQSSCRRDPTLCSPEATCVQAGENQFACVCNDGFTGDGTQCKLMPKHDANILLINQGMAILRIPFFPTPENPGSPIQITYTQMTIALDIDCTSGKAYTSDITGNRIASLAYNGSLSETFIEKVSSPEGLAIDWVSRNIFWTDSNALTVEVANLETKKRKILVSDGLVNPRGIAVHPYHGKIFWSDWNRNGPKLEWANEDGTGREIFLRGDNVKLPNSLAIDWATDEICWADAGTFTLNCARITSKEVRVVASELTYPFGLAISQNHYYSTDWKTQKVTVISKISGQKEEPLHIPPGGSGKLYGVVAVPEHCPRVSNICQYDNGRCNENQLCLPDGQGGRICACADNSAGPCTDTRS